MSDINKINKLTKVPNPEVSATKKKRRKFTAAYKLRILKESNSLRGTKGGIAALLRREGIYSSTLSQWRQQRDQGELSALGRIRGPKTRFTEDQLERERLEKENQRLRKKLQQASLLIEAQKKVAAILGNSLDLKSEEQKTNGGESWK
jgi:transposase-like protein